MTQNSFPMKEWHVEHMQKTVVKYVRGLPQDASGWERRNHKKYGNLLHICKQIEYDIRHGVTPEQVTHMLYKINHDPSFSALRQDSASMERLGEIQDHFAKPRIWFR